MLKHHIANLQTDNFPSILINEDDIWVYIRILNSIIGCGEKNNIIAKLMTLMIEDMCIGVKE